MIGRKIWCAAQVANLLGVTRPTVLKWIYRGILSAGRPGHRQLIGHAELLRFIKKWNLPTRWPLNGTNVYTILAVAAELTPYLRMAHDRLPQHRWLVADNFFDAGCYFAEYTPDVIVLDGVYQSLARRIQDSPGKLILVSPIAEPTIFDARLVAAPVCVDALVAAVEDCFVAREREAVHG